MIFEKTTVISNEMVTSNSYVIWLEASNLTKRGYYPGQFAMLKCNDANESESFSRAFSFHQRDGNRIAFLYTIVGKGTAWLSLRKQDDQIEVYGPLGEGFRIPRDTGRLLLLGGGIGIAPMPEMATFSISKGHQVTVIMGANTKTQLLPNSYWPKEVEYLTVTEDGSQGLHGLLTEHLDEPVNWASKLYACGPEPMFSALALTLRGNNRRQNPEILMEAPMPCGWGICYSCAIFTKHGVQLCCKDGPRFNLFEVY